MSSLFSLQKRTTQLQRFFINFLALGLGMALLMTLPSLAKAIDNANEDVNAEEAFLGEGPRSLPASSEPDTVRTNVWLVEALMAEIVHSTSRVLPPAPAAIQLESLTNKPEDGLFQDAVVRVLGGMGYDIYLPDEDPARQAAVDCIYSFSVQAVQLSYPEVGRTLGFWKNWIDRELTVASRVEVTVANSGRLLMSERVQRSFSDRVSAGHFELVDSQMYDFTTAETSESGWKGRMEEIIVLGTLAGLVAVYFSNTGD